MEKLKRQEGGGSLEKITETDEAAMSSDGPAIAPARVRTRRRLDFSQVLEAAAAKRALELEIALAENSKVIQ